MKIMKRSQQVTAAEGSTEPVKTEFYKLTLTELLDILKDTDTNIITIWQLEEQGFDAIDFKQLYGSGVVDEYLYICNTDGHDILVNGKQVDPEEIIDQLADGDIEEAAFADYIVDPDKKYIHRWVSPSEMTPPDFEAAAAALLQQPYKETLLTICRAAEEYDSFDD